MAAGNGHGQGINGVIISSDSHVMEPVDLWKKGVPEKYRADAPLFPPHKVGEGFQHHAGGWDPHARIKEMETDGLSAEVLYPTLMLDLFALDDAGMQEACFRVYNDWLIDYCRVDTNRLIGIPAIPVYNIDVGIKELERCHKAGLKGAIIWQAPHPDLPFHSSHYDKFWAAAQDLDTPVSLHILTGHSYNKDKERKGVERYRGSVNLKLMDIANGLFELIFYGVLERYPKLKIVTVENECGWLPWIVQQWDYYYNRFRKQNPPPITKNPSEFVHNQVYSCFFNDSVCGHNLEWWGQDTSCGPTIFPIRIQPGQTRSRSSSAISGIYRWKRRLRSWRRTSADSTTSIWRRSRRELPRPQRLPRLRSSWLLRESEWRPISAKFFTRRITPKLRLAPSTKPSL